jgi:hypothetical protein
MGLTYETTSVTLRGMGCGLSPTTLRHNVKQLHDSALVAPRLSRLRMDLVAPGRLAGPDGALGVWVDGNATARFLTVDVDHGSAADDLQWRLDQCARAVIGVPPRFSPPGSA